MRAVLGRYVSSMGAAALLAGCGGSQPPIGSPGAVALTSTPATHADRGKSWMLPEATSENLLYIADYGGGAEVYSYLPARLKFVGYLAAPVNAEGECVDKKQDVFITSSNLEIYEYAHGATSPKAILADPFVAPANCSVDPTTGNLAVVGYGFGKYKGVAIFEHARGKARLYSESWNSQACGYDDQGNLFIDGGGAGNIDFAELPKGTTKFINIPLNQSFNSMGGVQWDGKYLAIGDFYNSIIYEFSISGSTATEVGSTALSGSGTIWQFFIDRARGKVIVPSTFEEYGGFVGIYDYPAGGMSHRTLSFGSPFGVVVSLGHEGRS